MRTSLYEHSISVILNNQLSSGVYVASPSFALYRYSWFRDGAFIAYAVDPVGEHGSARRYHEWAPLAVLGHESRISPSFENAQRAIALAGSECFHSRFTLKEWRLHMGWLASMHLFCPVQSHESRRNRAPRAAGGTVISATLTTGVENGSC